MPQCGYNAHLTTSKDFCVGSSLSVSCSHTLGKIVWYENGVAVDSASAVCELGQTAKVIAGSGGKGSGPTQLNNPGGIALDQTNNLYVVDFENQRVQKFTPGALSGVTVAGMGATTTGLLNIEPSAIFIDPNGDLYVIDEHTNTLLEYLPGAASSVPVLSNPDLALASSIYVDCAGDIYVPDQARAIVSRFSPGASSGTLVAGGNGTGGAANQLSRPQWLWLDGAGNVYLLDNDYLQVRKWAPGATTGVTVADLTTLGKVFGATGLWVDGQGTVYTLIALLNGGAGIAKFTPGSTTGEIIMSEVAEGPADQLWQPWDLAMDTHGDIDVCDYSLNRVVQFPLNSSIDSSFTPMTSGRYWAVVTDMQGYTTNTDTVPINIPNAGPASIQITASATSAPVCVPISFSASVQNSGVDPAFQWLVSGVPVGGDSAGYSNTLFANGDQVACVLTTEDGCQQYLIHDTSNLITLAIDPHGAASVNITASKTLLCKGDPVNFIATITNGSASPGFAWLVNGDTVSGDTGPAFTSDSLPDGAVVYCLITSDDACGLAKSNSIPITINIPPVIAPGQVFTIPYGETLALTPEVKGSVNSWLWTPGSFLSDSTTQDPVADPPSNMNYQLIATAGGGCADTGAIIVNVYTPLSLPNAFTPNGDGRNDVFYMLGGPENSEIESFQVFDRWGMRVFGVEHAQAGDRNAGWDGRVRGTPAPAGVYVYVVVMRYATGQRQEYKGTVVLIR